MELELHSVERKPFYFEISLSGRLDGSTYSRLEQFIASLMKTQVKGIVLDMGRLDYISSMGLRVIFKTMKDLKPGNGVLLVTNMQPQVKKVFEIAKALPDDSIFVSVQEADQYYDIIQERVKKENQR